jgi:hypothetical protein
VSAPKYLAILGSEAAGARLDSLNGKSIELTDQLWRQSERRRVLDRFSNERNDVCELASDVLERTTGGFVGRLIV